MTSPGHKIGQILKLIYLRQYLGYSVDQKLKISEMLMAIVLVYSTSGITPGKKSLSGSKWRPFWKFWNIKHSFNLTSDMKRSSQIMPKKFLKMSEMLMAIVLVYSTSGITSGKKSLSGSKWRPFWKFWNIKHSFNLTSDMKRSSQIVPKMFLWWWRRRWRHRVASKFLSIFVFRRGWLREQIARAMSPQ